MRLGAIRQGREERKRSIEPQMICLLHEITSDPPITTEQLATRCYSLGDGREGISITHREQKQTDNTQDTGTAAPIVSYRHMLPAVVTSTQEVLVAGVSRVMNHSQEVLVVGVSRVMNPEPGSTNRWCVKSDEPQPGSTNR
ncbi:hypothetical protein RRG08_060389 [Elysia crispata]|uniref:Uncharacterized protein n=1 Tax=Elysia crispata TaxID=231223 RepID=A0AAE0ZGD0_9GAST|nr:hypothetical protein RRG08_060389 [Elysia crispata]